MVKIFILPFASSCLLMFSCFKTVHPWSIEKEFLTCARWHTVHVIPLVAGLYFSHGLPFFHWSLKFLLGFFLEEVFRSTDNILDFGVHGVCEVSSIWSACLFSSIMISSASVCIFFFPHISFIFITFFGVSSEKSFLFRSMLHDVRSNKNWRKMF